MTRFSMFSENELYTLEDGCCQVGAGWLIDEIRAERRIRERRKWDITEVATRIGEAYRDTKMEDE